MITNVQPKLFFIFAVKTYVNSNIVSLGVVRWSKKPTIGQHVLQMPPNLELEFHQIECYV